MRLKNSMRNILVACLGQIIGILITFIARMVFVKLLSEEYLGINGLFLNILSMLSLVELGIGSAIVFSLYKPLAVKDELKIKALMCFYSKAYKLIGVIVLLLGLMIYPFLDFIIKDQSGIPNVNMYFILFLMNSVISYFFSYKRTLIIADQNNYIASIYRYGCFFLLNITQIFVLILTKNYVLFLCAQILYTFIENILVSKKADKLYPYIRNNNEELDKETKNEIIKNVKALFFHRVGAVMVLSTDNIIISSFIGIAWVGIYSNYYLITSAINTIIAQVFTSITSSVGNLNALETKEKSYEIFKITLFVNFWMIYLCSICLLVLLNPFISLWLGNEYVLEDSIVIIIVINFYVNGMRKTVLMFKETYGLFWNDRYKAIFEALINLVASIALAKVFNLIGVFVGTLISTMATCFWIEPLVLYKYGFKRSMKEYFAKYCIYTMVAGVASVVTLEICRHLFIFTLMSTQVSLGDFFGQLGICLIIPNVIFLPLFYRTKEFQNLYERIRGYLNNLLNKVKIGSHS